MPMIKHNYNRHSYNRRIPLVLINTKPNSKPNNKPSKHSCIVIKPSNQSNNQLSIKRPMRLIQGLVRIQQPNQCTMPPK